MAVSMNAADIAVSKQGINNFLNNIRNNTASAQKKVYSSSDGFRNMVNTIRTYWSGTDADNFIADLTTSASDITSMFNEVYNRLYSAFNEYYNQFLRLQSRTYTKGSIRIR